MHPHPRHAHLPLIDLGAQLAFDIPKLTDEALCAVSWVIGEALEPRTDRDDELPPKPTDRPRRRVGGP